MGIETRKIYGSETHSNEEIEAIISEAKKRITIITPDIAKSFSSHGIGECISNRLLNEKEVNIITNEKEDDKKKSIEKTLDTPLFFPIIQYANKRNPGILKNFNVYLTKNQLCTNVIIADNNCISKYIINGEHFGTHIRRDNRQCARIYYEILHDNLKNNSTYKIETIEFFRKAKSAKMI